MERFNEKIYVECISVLTALEELQKIFEELLKCYKERCEYDKFLTISKNLLKKVISKIHPDKTKFIHNYKTIFGVDEIPDKHSSLFEEILDLKKIVNNVRDSIDNKQISHIIESVKSTIKYLPILIKDLTEVGKDLQKIHEIAEKERKQKADEAQKKADEAEKIRQINLEKTKKSKMEFETKQREINQQTREQQLMTQEESISKRNNENRKREKAEMKSIVERKALEYYEKLTVLNRATEDAIKSVKNSAKSHERREKKRNDSSTPHFSSSFSTKNFYTPQQYSSSLSTVEDYYTPRHYSSSSFSTIDDIYFSSSKKKQSSSSSHKYPEFFDNTRYKSDANVVSPKLKKTSSHDEYPELFDRTKHKLKVDYPSFFDKTPYVSSYRRRSSVASPSPTLESKIKREERKLKTMERELFREYDNFTNIQSSHSRQHNDTKKTSSSPRSPRHYTQPMDIVVSPVSSSISSSSSHPMDVSPKRNSKKRKLSSRVIRKHHGEQHTRKKRRKSGGGT